MPASAAAQSRLELELGFGTGDPDAVAGMRLNLLYRGPDPDGKPSPLRSGVIEAPAGTRFGGGDAIPACTAGDADFRARGRDACPPASRIGGGVLVAITGFGPPFDPFRTDAHIFKSPNGFVEIVQQPGSNTTVGMDRVEVSGSRITPHPPSTPGGPPDGETAVREIRFLFPAGGFVRTPPGCPPDGLWRSRATFTFADGYTATATDAVPCRRPPTPPPAARAGLRLTVSPRSVPRALRVRYRFRVRAATAACRRGVLIRFAGRRVRTNRLGLATTRVRLTRRGLRRALASKPGCGSTPAFVRVRSR